MSASRPWGGDKLRAEFVGLGQDGKAAFDAIGRGAANASGPVEEFERRSRQTGSGVGRMGSQIQNAGYQVQDFAVQVAGGTSATRAMGQQLPQLLSGFGVWGTVVGTAVAVGLPLISMLFRTGEASKTAKEQLEDLEKSTSAMTRSAAAAATPIRELRATYGDLADEVNRANQAMASITAATAARDAMSAARLLGGELGDDLPSMNAYLGADGNVMRGYESARRTLVEQAIEAIRTKTGATVDEAERLIAAIGRLGRSPPPLGSPGHH